MQKQLIRVAYPTDSGKIALRTEADWDAAAKHLVAALDKYKVPEAEKNELLAFVVTQKKDIVEK